MTIQEKDLKLVEEYNGTTLALWMDILYIRVCESYIHLLDGTEWDVSEISDTLYINSILEKNASTKEAKYIGYIKNPIETIQDGLRRISEALPLYKSYHNTGISKKDIIWDNTGYLSRIREEEMRREITDDAKMNAMKKDLAKALQRVGHLEGVTPKRMKNKVAIKTEHMNDYLLITYLGQLLEHGEMEIRIAPEGMEYLKKLLHLDHGKEG